MSSSSYRIYIRFGVDNCVRLLAPGAGVPGTEGLELFEWLQDPNNIVRLRNGIQYIYEIDEKELRYFLDSKLRGDRSFRMKQMNKHAGGEGMLAAFKQDHLRFDGLRTGVDKLEAISNAAEITAIPRTSPRKRSDKSRWLYLLDLDQETLELYGFKDYTSQKFTPSARLTVKSLFRKSPHEPHGYYIKVKLSELQTMWRSEWLSLHAVHVGALKQLWKRNAEALQTIPHADNIPFAMLYGSVPRANRTDSRNSRRLTRTSLTTAMAALNRRKPSKMSIFERKSNRPNAPRRVTDAQSRVLQARLLRLQGAAKAARHRRQTMGTVGQP
ncbi:hypothetical protein F5Y10DRAFT_107913 [Nemania abortiva]|nr:hypothetical protein F5Y10DRAFT_107913 [Nemania abortiva]